MKWSVFWRKDESGLPTRRHTLLVARNVLTGEVKYFIANRVPGEVNPVTGERVTVRWLLRVAFGRWSIENVFREGKEELGLDHWEVRGWRCVHRHFFLTQLSHLFCARMRSEFNASPDTSVRVTLEGVRSAINVWLDTQDLCPRCRCQRLADEAAHQQYHATRNEQARQSHRKTRVSTRHPRESTSHPSNPASIPAHPPDESHDRHPTYDNPSPQSGAVQVGDSFHPGEVYPEHLVTRTHNSACLLLR